jgi:cytochrome d ubiquinol oxidase subunit I
LPTFYAASSLSALDLILSLSFFVLLYTVLLIIMVILMVRIIKAGPKDKLFTGEDDEYDFVMVAHHPTPANKELGS